MECFGDIQKLPTCCSEFSRSLTSRVAATASVTEILITESANLVTKYDLEQHKSVNSWSFNELNKLLIPAVVNYSAVADGANNKPRRRETLIGVHSGNTLIEWQQGDSDQILQSAKKQFKSNTIAALLSFSKTKLGPLVVFSNGYIEYFEKVKFLDFDEDQVTAVIDPNEQIIGIERMNIKKMVMLYYIVKNTVTKQKAVYKLTLSQQSPEVTKTERVSLTEDIQAWTYNRSAGGFIGACKKGSRIFCYSLEPTASSDSMPKDHIFNLDSRTVEGLDSSSTDTLCSLASCSNGAICVLTEKTATSETAYQLQVFETKYYTKIGELNFSELIFTRDFHVVNNNVVLTCKNNVIVVPILEQNILLSQLLTKNFTEEQKSEVKKRNTEKFTEFLGISEQEEVRDLLQMRQLNGKFAQITAVNGDDIPEELIVSLFNFCTHNCLVFREKEGQNKHKKLVLAELELFFGLLAKLPFNEIFLVSCLKSSSITFAQYLLGIEWLLNMMPSKDCCIISWISALLDANFRQFIIKPSAEAHAALNRIYFHLNRSIHFYEELGPIKTMFESLVKRDRTVVSAVANDTHTIGQYSIELLSFS